MSTDQHNEINAAIEGFRSRLDTLASITADTIFATASFSYERWLVSKLSRAREKSHRHTKSTTLSCTPS
jgi:hypothetical protein